MISAYAWAENYVPTRNGEIYDPILEFAKDSYKEVAQLSETLDKKADDLMKISGAIGAALAAAGRVAGLQESLTTIPILTAIGCLISTMLICARARKPVTTLMPMTIRAVIDVAEKSLLSPILLEESEAKTSPKPIGGATDLIAGVNPSTAQVKATIAASYHWAMSGTQHVAKWKAKLLTAANLVFCVGLRLLILGFAGSLFWKKLLLLV